MQNKKCPGCGRPLSQHIHNSILNREETEEDYAAWSIDCPAQKSLAVSQSEWQKLNKSDLDKYYEGKGPDPGAGLYWISQGPGEPDPLNYLGGEDG